MTEEEQAITPEGADAPEEQPEANADAGKGFEGIASTDDELSRLAIARSLGFEKIGEFKKYQDQIDRLLQWTKAEGAKDLTEIVTKINELRNEVGHSKNIFNLSVYAGMVLEKLKLEKELKEFKDEPTTQADTKNL